MLSNILLITNEIFEQIRCGQAVRADGDEWFQIGEAVIPLAVPSIDPDSLMSCVHIAAPGDFVIRSATGLWGAITRKRLLAECRVIGAKL